MLKIFTPVAAALSLAAMLTAAEAAPVRIGSGIEGLASRAQTVQFYDDFEDDYYYAPRPVYRPQYRVYRAPPSAYYAPRPVYREPRPIYREPRYGFYDREDAKDYVKGYRRAQKEIFKDQVRGWNRAHGF
jgi:hypothetical protein